MNHELQGSDLHGYEKKYDEGRELIKRLFAILHRVECSEGGRYFNPTTIGSCRVLETEKLKVLLPALMEHAGVLPAESVRNLNLWEAKDRGD